MKFTDTHEWVSQEGKFYAIGITKHAKQEIGEIVYVELPKVGSFVKRGDDACVVESCKAAIVIASPLSGKVVAVNDSLNRAMNLINEHPETEGWLYRIEATEPAECDRLLSLLDYTHLIRGL